MAAVVTTTTINRKDVWGTRRVVNASLAFDTGDYAAGGVAVTPGQFGLHVIDDVIVLQAIEVSATPTANLGMYNPATSKIRFFQADTTDGDPFQEKAAEAFGAGANCRVLVIGY